jgi:pyruvate/2-oxoacid:ferredoxin oxidoreductase beta subunit
MSLSAAARVVESLSSSFPHGLVVDARGSAHALAAAVTPASDAEEAFGLHLAHAASRARLVDDVQAVLASRVAGRQLSAGLSAWLSARADGGACAAAAAEHELEQWLVREGAFDAAISSLHSSRALFSKRSQWTVLCDGWGAGSDAAALHTFLASGEDLNVLVLATDPAADVRGAAAPRLDLGLYALNYVRRFRAF